MTDHGKAYVMNRLSSCPNLDTLRRVWDGLGVEYQRDASIIAHKEALKATLGGEA